MPTLCVSKYRFVPFEPQRYVMNVNNNSTSGPKYYLYSIIIIIVPWLCNNILTNKVTTNIGGQFNKATNKTLLVYKSTQ